MAAVTDHERALADDARDEAAFPQLPHRPPHGLIGDPPLVREVPFRRQARALGELTARDLRRYIVSCLDVKGHQRIPVEDRRLGHADHCKAALTYKDTRDAMRSYVEHYTFTCENTLVEMPDGEVDRRKEVAAMTSTQTARTIGVTARSSSRFSRLKVRYPAEPRPRWGFRGAGRYPDLVDNTDYDAALAMELLRRTGELPASKRELIVLLIHYRCALHALATQILGSQTGESH